MTMADQDIRAVRPDASTSQAPTAGASAGGAGRAAADQDPRVVELQHQLGELQQQVSELEDRWRRALAEADNLRKRYERDSAQQRARERAQVAAAWLPVLDHLELALAHATANPTAIIDGVRGVRDQALAVLAGLGFPRRDDVGTTFDPARHEAVAATPAHHVPAGTVLEVVRPGYGEGDWQLRPAAVVVAAATTAEGNDSGSGDRRDAGAR
jgi:molecular chaperone GrpE